MNKLKELNKEPQSMYVSCQLVFSNKFNPLEIYDMIFNDEMLTELFQSKYVLCRIGEYQTDKLGYYSYDRFITKFDKPCVMMHDVYEMDNSFQSHISIPSMYVPKFTSLQNPVIHPVVITYAESMTGFRIAYFVVYDKNELIATNIYSGKWWDYDKR